MSDDAIFCVGCGYDLRSLRVDGPCPECGRAIADSLDGRRLAAADSHWLARLVIGQSLVVWGLHLALIGVCLMPLIGSYFASQSPLSGAVAHVAFVVFIVLPVLVAGGMALVWIGAVLVTVPDPGGGGQEPVYSARNLARWGIAASTVFTLLAVIVPSLPIPVVSAVVAQIVLPLLAAISVTFGLSALLRCLAEHASRIPDQDLARRTYRLRRVLRWVLPVFVVAMILCFSLSWLPVLVPALAGIKFSRIQAVFGVAGIGLGCVVLFLLARLSTLMRRYRMAFRAARNASGGVDADLRRPSGQLNANAVAEDDDGEGFAG